MAISVRNQNNRFELLIWLTTAILLSVAVGAHYFTTYSLFLRVLAMLAAVAVSAWLLSKTTVGQAGIKLWRESLLELRKVVWPTRKETLNHIIAVVVMVVVMGLLLGIMDWVLSKSLHWLLSSGGV
jgi:preprotein translocase subunit SecE